jgi:hypothetical protein
MSGREDNIKIDLKETDLEGVDWINMLMTEKSDMMLWIR